MAKKRSGKSISKWVRKVGKPIFKMGFKLMPVVLGIAFVLFLAVGVRQMLHADPYFQIEKITIFPAGLLNQAEIRYLESSAKSKSLLEVDLKALSRSLERNPKILRAEITRVLPKQLNIFLTRRLPVFQVQSKPNGPYFLIASDQLILSTVKQPKPDIFILEDHSGSQKNYSAGMLYQSAFMKALLKVRETLKTDSILGEETVSKITIDHLGNMSIFLKDGLELKIGKEFNLSSSNRMVLSSMLDSRQRAEYLYLDLRYRDILVKKKSDQS